MTRYGDQTTKPLSSHLLNTIVSYAPIWNLQSPRTFPEMNEQNPAGSFRCTPWNTDIHTIIRLPLAKSGHGFIHTEREHLLGGCWLLFKDPEVIQRRSTTSGSVVDTLKAIKFAEHGIPETVVSDNGLQHASEELTRVAVEYSFIHITRSSHFPQSNGQAERCVQTVKNLLVKS